MEFSTIWAPRILSVLRIVDGLILLQYGLAKLLGWPAVEIFENLKWLSLFGIAGMFELVGGTLLILGLFTRPVAFILSGEMAAAYFIEHFQGGCFPALNEVDLARQHPAFPHQRLGAHELLECPQVGIGLAGQMHGSEHRDVETEPARVQ